LVAGVAKRGGHRLAVGSLGTDTGGGKLAGLAA